MPNLDAFLRPRAAFADLPFAPTAHRGVIASERDGLGLATLLVRKGKRSALAQRLQEHFNIDLPLRPYRTTIGALALAGTGPGAWLAVFEHGGNGFAVRLKDAVGELASVSDQSDGYAVLRLSGPKVRDTLGKLVPIDVHPRAFHVGDVAVTMAAHMSATLWRLDDQPGGSPVFEIAVFRSVARSFWQALLGSAAEFGFDKPGFELTMMRGSDRRLPAADADADASSDAEIETSSP